MLDYSTAFELLQLPVHSVQAVKIFPRQEDSVNCQEVLLAHRQLRVDVIILVGFLNRHPVFQYNALETRVERFHSVLVYVIMVEDIRTADIQKMS